jgi:hypothetical protein
MAALTAATDVQGVDIFKYLASNGFVAARL